MKTHITEIEVEFTTDEMGGIRKAYSLTGNEAPVRKYSQIRRVSELESILETLNAATEKDLERTDRTRILKARKEIKRTLVHIESAES